MTLPTTARANIAARYRQAGNDADAEKVLTVPGWAHWKVRHEEERLKRERGDGE